MRLVNHNATLNMHTWTVSLHTLLLANFFAFAGDDATYADKDEICAKIEGLGGVVIDKYDQDAVSLFNMYI